MKFLCPGCDRLVELAAYRLDAGALLLRCPRCGEESRAEPLDPTRPAHPEPPVAPAVRPALFSKAANVVQLRPGASEAVRLAAEAARSEDPFRVPEGRCPKCIAIRAPQATACPGCGLLFELLDPESIKPPSTLAERWRTVLARWDDLAVHDELLHEALLRGELAAIGRLYRLRLAISPDDPISMRGRDEVVRLATAQSASAPLEDRGADPHARWKIGAGVAFLALCIGVVAILARRLILSSP